MTDHCPICKLELVRDQCLSCGNLEQVNETPGLYDRINQILRQDDIAFDSVLDRAYEALNTLFLCLYDVITPKKTFLNTNATPDDYGVRYCLFFTAKGGLVYELLNITIHPMTDDNEFPIRIIKDDDKAICSIAEFDRFLVSQVKGIRRSIKIINKLTVV